MTRLLLLIFTTLVVSACDRSFLEVSPDPERPVGLGLTASHSVQLIECTDHLGGEDCVSSDVDVRGVTVSGAVDLVRVEDGRAVIHGARVGPARVCFDTSEGGATAKTEVVEIARTHLDLNRDTLPRDLSREPLHALTHSLLAINQEHDYDAGFAIPFDARGLADLVLTGSATGASVDSSFSRTSFVKTGETPGLLHISTTVGGDLYIDVIELEAVATLTLWRANLEDQVETIVVRDFVERRSIVPLSAIGETIVGVGSSAPTIRVTPADVIEVELADTDEYSLHHAIRITRLAPGAAEVHLEWGPASAVFAVEANEPPEDEPEDA